MRFLFSFIATCIVFMQCQKEVNSAQGDFLPFETLPEAAPVLPGTIDEASGIADSKNNPGFIWVQQDGGNPPELFLLSYTGNIQKKIPVTGVTNRDWEDIVVGNGPVAGTNYIYIAETGDNNAAYTDYAIYRFPEPAIGTDTIFTTDKITFQYPDGPHDAEAILVENSTKDIYIISKRDSTSRVYKLPYPQSTTTTMIATAAGTATFTGVSAAAISPDEKELLVKTYTNVYYWKRNVGETIEAALQRNPLTLGYVLEPQGEAMCFKNDNTAFLTLSERPFFATSVALNMYRRK